MQPAQPRVEEQITSTTRLNLAARARIASVSRRTSQPFAGKIVERVKRAVDAARIAVISVRCCRRFVIEKPLPHF
jgi:hypothetical protein